MSKKVISRKTEKVHVLEDNLSIKENHGLNCSLFNINPLLQSCYYKLHMNKQSLERQLINRLNNVCAKINLCIHTVIHHVKFILRMHEMHCTKNYPQKYMLLCIKNYCAYSI